MLPVPNQPAGERRRPFLTARWSNPILLTYAVPPEFLAGRLPSGLEPDRYGADAHVSLVAFDFQDTRIRGRRIPGYVNFPEINLRAYVRRGDATGVVFFGELVPSRIVAAVARLKYNEPYRAAPLSSHTAGTADGLTVEHHWRWRGRAHRLRATGSQTSRHPPADSLAWHLVNRRRGYGVDRGGGLMTYRVEHPEWTLRELQEVEYDIDFGHCYGPEWAFLDRAEPTILFATGSAVQIFAPGR